TAEDIPKVPLDASCDGALRLSNLRAFECANETPVGGHEVLSSRRDERKRECIERRRTIWVRPSVHRLIEQRDTLWRRKRTQRVNLLLKPLIWRAAGWILVGEAATKLDQAREERLLSPEAVLPRPNDVPVTHRPLSR